jgi:lysophospholipase L1-like esterase
MTRHAPWLLPLAALVWVAPARAVDEAADWVEPMKKVHEKFTGTKGTLAQFGDSITVTLAYWSSLQGGPKNGSAAATKAYDLVKGYMKPQCWRDWKGPDYGSNGRMTIRWAHENVDMWLKNHNPEVATIMFGTNDLTQVDAKEYEQKTREVVDKCLKNGTIVILTTIPPRSGLVDKSKQYAEIDRKIAKEMKVPLIDYSAEILKRRPDDWDGSKFKDVKDAYQVPTLIAGDGVHPSNPTKFQDCNEEGLKSNGYLLRSYLTMMSYADVIDKVLQPKK